MPDVSIIMSILSQTYQKNRLLLSIFAISIAVFIGSYTVPESIGYSTLTYKNHENITYNTHSDDLQLSTIKEFSESLKSDYKELTISYYVKVNAISGWNNIFQTAPLNSGIRMELSEPSTLGLVIKNNNNEGYRGFNVTDKLQLNRWYFVKVKIDTNNHIIVILDNETIIDAIDPGIDYDISEIAIGTGFSKSRPFNGELSKFNISYTLLKKNSILLLAILGLKLISIVTIVMMPFAFINEKPLRRESKIALVGLTILIGFILSVCHYWLLRRTGFYSNVYDFMLSPIDIFKDFTNINFYVRENNPYALNISPVSQFPFLFRVASLFNLLPENLAIITFMTLFSVFILYYCFKNIAVADQITTIKNILIFSLLSYPVLFALSRGNYELIVFIFVALFVYFYEKNNITISILFLSLAIAMKPFPGIFLILFLSDRKYKEAVYAALLATLITIASYASFHEGFLVNVKLHLVTLHMYNNDYAIANAGLAYGNSLFGTIKILIAYLYPRSFNEIVTSLFSSYTTATLIMFGLISTYLIILEKEYWKKIALLVFCMNLFPHVSADYKLIHLFIPLFLFINKSKSDGNDRIYVILFSLLLISKSYFYFSFDPSTAITPFTTNTAVLLNPALMITGVLMIVTSGLYNRFGYIFMNNKLSLNRK